MRLNVGTNVQGNGELNWDGRVLPDLDFWQINVGMQGLSIEKESLSVILGETARPVLDKDGHAVIEGYDAFRGTVEDYRVSGPLGTEFPLLSIQYTGFKFTGFITLKFSPYAHIMSSSTFHETPTSWSRGAPNIAVL